MLEPQDTEKWKARLVFSASKVEATAKQEDRQNEIEFKADLYEYMKRKRMYENKQLGNSCNGFALTLMTLLDISLVSRVKIGKKIRLMDSHFSFKNLLVANHQSLASDLKADVLGTWASL